MRFGIFSRLFWLFTAWSGVQKLVSISRLRLAWLSGLTQTDELCQDGIVIYITFAISITLIQVLPGGILWVPQAGTQVRNKLSPSVCGPLEQLTLFKTPPPCSGLEALPSHWKPMRSRVDGKVIGVSLSSPYRTAWIGSDRTWSPDVQENSGARFGVGERWLLEALADVETPGTDSKTPCNIKVSRNTCSSHSPVQAKYSNSCPYNLSLEPLSQSPTRHLHTIPTCNSQPSPCSPASWPPRSPPRSAATSTPTTSPCATRATTCSAPATSTLAPAARRTRSTILPPRPTRMLVWVSVLATAASRLSHVARRLLQLG